MDDNKKNDWDQKVHEQRKQKKDEDTIPSRIRDNDKPPSKKII